MKGCPKSSKSGTAARRDRAVQTAARKVQGCVPKAVQTAAREGEKTAANDEAVGTQQATRAVGTKRCLKGGSQKEKTCLVLD